MKRLISALAAVFVMTLCLTPALGAEDSGFGRRAGTACFR